MTLVAVTSMHNRKDSRCSLSDAYIQAMESAGIIPVILSPCLSPEASVMALHRMDGLLLSGGTDMSPLHYGQQPRPGLGSIDSYRDEQEIALVREATKLGLPIFGICRGIQVINAVLGGTITQHISKDGEAIQHEQNAAGWHRHHHVEITPGTMLASIFGAGDIGVNSYHHQAVDQLAPGLVVSAISPDGVIEGVESTNPWILGVQWHPELMVNRHREFLGLFKVFAEACKGKKLCQS